MKNFTKCLALGAFILSSVANAGGPIDRDTVGRKRDYRVLTGVMAEVLLETSRNGMRDPWAKALKKFAHDPINASTSEFGYVSGVMSSYKVSDTQAFRTVFLPQLEKLSPTYMNELKQILASDQVIKRYSNLVRLKQMIDECGWDFVNTKWCADELKLAEMTTN